MNPTLKLLAIIGISFGTSLHLRAQGYIVPNGVVYSGYLPGVGFSIDVMYSPTNLFYTGFALNPVGTTPPSPYPNTFRFNPIVDVSVRVFLVSPNDPVSLEPILAGNYTELLSPNSYEFDSDSPFYVGLYTGNVQYAPPDGIYDDPLFGWAELVNNMGVIELLGGAMAYKAGGIYAGTENIFYVPEPSVLGLSALGALLLGSRGLKRRR